MTIRKVLHRISVSAIRKDFKIAKIAGLGIEVVSSPPAWDRYGRRIKGRLEHLPITCFAYAIGLHESSLYREGLPQWFEGKFVERVVDDRFMEWLLSGLRATAPHRDCLVVYFDGSTPKHAGILVGTNRVKSKWGLFKQLFVHQLWHVPESYGSSVQYFRSITKSQSEALLREAYNL
jgi:hypothetical protein